MNLKPNVMENLVNYQEGSVVSREIVSKPTGTVTLFAFDQGQGLSEHRASYDALILILDGEAEVTVLGIAYNLKKGETITMPANSPHSLKAKQKFKMVLIMIKS